MRVWNGKISKNSLPLGERWPRIAAAFMHLMLASLSIDSSSFRGDKKRCDDALHSKSTAREFIETLICYSSGRGRTFHSQGGPSSPRLRRDRPESFQGWRRGELNPCPRRYPRKHLHVYPAINSEEPSLAPAHCRLPSVHEFPSPSGAVAPPFD